MLFITSNPESFSPFVQEFLDLDDESQGCQVTACGLCCQVMQYVVSQGRSDDAKRLYSKCDTIMAKLTLSGMLPVCLEMILKHPASCAGREMALVLFDTCCHKDIVWQIESEGMIYQLAKLKVFLGCIPYLAHLQEETTDSKVRTGLTRLVARTIMNVWDCRLDLKLLKIGADARLWNQAVQQAGESWLVTPQSRPKVLCPPSEADRKFLNWLISHKAAYYAIEGWLQAGAWKRSPEIAGVAPSWKKMRALLLVGVRHASSFVDIPDHVELDTLAEATNLRMSSLEEKNGTVSYICSNPGCVVKMGSRCSQCTLALYCGKSCQRKHWKLGHKEECKVLKSCVGDEKVEWSKLAGSSSED